MTNQTIGTPTGPVCFTFGDPVPVLDRPWFLDYLECGTSEKMYEPPLAWESLTRSFRAMAHHPSALQVKLNILTNMMLKKPRETREKVSVLLDK